MGKDGEFLDAARCGNINIVEKYLTAKARRSGPLASLRRGPGANIQDTTGYTALHHAALNGHKNVVELLLRHEASVNVQDNKGSTPLHLASWAGHSIIVKKLIHHGPSVPHINHQNKGGETALHCAAQHGHLDTTRLLLDQGGDPALPNLKAETPLDLAAQFGRQSLVDLLVKKSHHDLLQPYTEDAATTAVFPHTPLHLASRNGHLGVVRTLITNGHSVNVRTSHGSPLHEAALCGKIDVVRTLMEAGADAGVRNDLGHTVLDTISSINTPVTKEISGIIKSLHARLIDIDDDVPSFMSALSGSFSLERSGSSFEACSSPAPVTSSGLSPIDAPIATTTTLSLSHAILTPSPAILIPDRTIFELSNLRPSSAPVTSGLSISKRGVPDGASLASSTPPLVHVGIPSPTEFGCPYENVLVPTRLYDESFDGETNTRTIDKRPVGKASSGKAYSKRISDNRRSDRDSSRFSDRESGSGGRLSDRESRLSDLDGRTSVASHLSETLSEFSVYDVPRTPIPKTTPTASSADRSSVSTRSSSVHDILDDDSFYEVPPPPRSCHTNCLRPAKERPDSISKGSKPQPPPKPPRRSICPPSPTPGDGGNSYEMICFASSGKAPKKNASDKCADSSEISGYKLVESDPDNDSYEAIEVTSVTSASFGKEDRTSSESDSELSWQRSPSLSHSNKTYTSMSFKPVKSRRTSKMNAQHSYENFDSHPHSKRGPGVRTASSKSSENVLYTSDSGRNNCHPADHSHSNCPVHSTAAVFQDPWVPQARRPHPQRAQSLQAKMAVTDASSEDFDDDSDDGRRPKSLDFGLCDDDEAESHLQKRNSRDIETETDPEDSLHVELRSTGVGTPPSPSALLRSEDWAPEGGTKGNGGGAYEAVSGSSCSLSSASVASLSDRSASTDNIEEIKSDIPFAGLYRGSRVPTEWLSGEPGMALERPRSLTSPASALRPNYDKDVRKSFPCVPKVLSTNNTFCNINNNSINNNVSSSADQIYLADKKGVALSPLEEAEEWARIQDIMASFGSGLARESVFMAELEKEFQQRLGMSLSPSQSKLRSASRTEGGDKPDTGATPPPPPVPPASVGAWLKEHRLGQYEGLFLAQGFDDVKFLNGLLDRQDLEEMGVTEPTHLETILAALDTLSPAPSSQVPNCPPPDTLADWLKAIQLPQYEDTFRKHGFSDMEKVRKIWEVELSVVLEVTQPGHRKRMLSSLGDRPIEPQLPPSLGAQDLSIELSKLNSDISELKQKLFQELPNSTSRERRPPETATNTIRRGTTKRRPAPPPPTKAPRNIKNSDQALKERLSSSTRIEDLPLREPSQLVVGAPNTVLSSWKHHPAKLVDSSVQYVAQYLGSTHVKELKGTESTMKSIHKLRRSTHEAAKVPIIILAVSYMGVRFIDAPTQSVVCDHEIRNIHCACQDADDLSHFAYITIDIETKGHFCHVFRVQSRDLANEIVMTIGQAFEVAYQLARRKIESNQSDEEKIAHGHTRSLSEHVRCKSNLLPNGASHTRSHSSVSHQYVKGTTAPHTSREDLLSDSGSNLVEESSTEGVRERTPSCSSSPSSSSTSESSCLQQKPSVNKGSSIAGT